jgi:hypothetical protein
MKNMIFIFFLFISGQINAAEILLASIKKEDTLSRTVLTEFKYSAARSEAWVEIVLKTTHPEGDSYYYPIKVAGLRFDSSSKSIILSDEDEIVCAEYKQVGRGLSRLKKLVMTEACSFEVRPTVRTYIENQQVNSISVLDIFLVVEEDED